MSKLVEPDPHVIISCRVHGQYGRNWRTDWSSSRVLLGNKLEGETECSEAELMTERGGDERIGTCPTCGQTFPTQEELSKHIMDAHEGERLPVPDPRKT
jgi:hypothetical protein